MFFLSKPGAEQEHLNIKYEERNGVLIERLDVNSQSLINYMFTCLIMYLEA